MSFGMRHIARLCHSQLKFLQTRNKDAVCFTHTASFLYISYAGPFPTCGLWRFLSRQIANTGLRKYRKPVAMDLSSNVVLAGKIW